MDTKYADINRFLRGASEELKNIILTINDEEQLDIINRQIDNGKDYVIRDLFTKEYIDIYGIDLIIKNLDFLSESILRVGLEDERAKEVIKTAKESNKKSNIYNNYPYITI